MRRLFQLADLHQLRLALVLGRFSPRQRAGSARGLVLAIGRHFVQADVIIALPDQRGPCNKLMAIDPTNPLGSRGEFEQRGRQ